MSTYSYQLIEPNLSLTVHKSKDPNKAILKCYRDMLNMGCKFQRRFVILDTQKGGQYVVNIKQQGGNNTDLLSIGNENDETVGEKIDVLNKKQDDERIREQNIESQLAAISIALNKSSKTSGTPGKTLGPELTPNVTGSIVYDLNPYITNLQKLHNIEPNKQSLCIIL